MGGRPVTHADLVLAAIAWLRKTARCRVVLSEMVAGTMQEIPDAIGWRLGFYSTLVECKISRADLLRERHKIKTRIGGGMGHERYVLAPDGVDVDTALPRGWGLLRFDGRKVRRVIAAQPRVYKGDEFQQRMRLEMPLLVSAVQRHEIGCRWDGRRARFESYNARKARGAILERIDAGDATQPAPSPADNPA